jgi:hypothetical protein
VKAHFMSLFSAHQRDVSKSKKMSQVGLEDFQFSLKQKTLSFDEEDLNPFKYL